MDDYDVGPSAFSASSTKRGMSAANRDLSAYGVGVTQVTVPAGDARFQRSGTATLARVFVLSDFTGNRALLQGTSMASSHVPGVAALAISAHGRMSHRRAGTSSAGIRERATR